MANNQDLMEAGRTAGAYGVRGWVRVVPHARDGEFLFEVDTWWLLPYPRKPGVVPKRLDVKELKAHGKEFIAKFEGVDQKEAADALKGSLLVDRNDLPELEEGDYYDDDLLGLTVINHEGVVLGKVCGVADNGAQDLLEVQPEDEKAMSFYIPMVENYVIEIDFEEECVKVDWSADWN